jgi:hypothetical protein
MLVSNAKISPMTPMTPAWIERMRLYRWYAISGDHPDLQLPSGTRYLIDTDPALDPDLNPARTIRERLRRMSRREPNSPCGVGHGNDGGLVHPTFNVGLLGGALTAINCSGSGGVP